MEGIKEIIVVFKTHLDVGFTDLAEKVVNDYINKYIPNAVRAATEVRAQNERFIWTTGSWLIAEYLRRRPEDADFTAAIERGDIRWHALSCTTHTELMDARLFNHSLGLSKALDERFGMTTRAAKMTDVPGHTRAMVPHMAHAGVRFLHIGVNSACPAPAVPPLFRWQAPDGSEVIVMYQNNYGEFQEIGDSGIALCFAHTNDNCGPQNADEVLSLFAALRKAHPNAKITAGTLEDVAAVAESLTDLPVVTQEIGDTWIHGAGCDPLKVSRYRATLRACAALPAAEVAEVYNKLLLVPEHTWGLDEKITIGADGWENCHKNFVRKDFEAVRGTEPYRRMEKSWAEQRRYVQNAIDVLREKYPIVAEGILTETECPVVPVRACSAGRVNEPMQMNDYTVTVNENGAIVGLVRNGKTYADASHVLGAPLYQAFSESDYQRYFNEYVTHLYEWALEDIGKPGCGAAIAETLTVKPIVKELWYDADDLIIELVFEGDAHTLYGAPARLTLSWRFLPEDIHLDARWYGKPASRVGEAMWLGFRCMTDVAAIRKLSEWVNPADVVAKGNNRLHATDYGVRFRGGCEIETFDAALVNIGAPAMLTFPTTAPALDEGVYFNLHNNVWGTNFVMWYEEDARFRFTLHLPR